MQYDLSWVRNKFDRDEPLEFIFFWGHSNTAHKPVGKFVFSQWYHSPFTVEGKTYQTAEHWMMAGKAALFENHDMLEEILEAEKPGMVKDLGRQIKGFDEARWNAEKFEIVKTGNVHKFAQHTLLKEGIFTKHR